MPKIEFKIKNKKKTALYLFVLIIALYLLFSSIFSLLFKPSPVKKQAPEPIMAAPAQKNNNQARSPVKPQNNKQVSKQTQIQIGLNNNVDSVLAINPFVEIKSLPKIDKPEINTSLPAIPNGVPAPSVGNIPIPAIPASPNEMSIPTPAKPASVSGILKGPNGNMAIMSDGKVVAEGDTYQDGRIAYIGGDGIEFDNGKKIDYK